MDQLSMRKLTPSDGEDIYQMLQHIKKEENAFTNSAFGLTVDAYHAWLKQQHAWSEGRNLPDGFVPQSTYWLYLAQTPIGYGKIRHQLTESSRITGGNIGFAIALNYRGHGFAAEFLALLICEAKRMGIEELLFTVEKFNYASKRSIEKNGAEVFKENRERWYLTV